MESIKVPDWVKEQLSEDERVISEFSSKFSVGNVSFYATDKRLLRFVRKSDCDSVQYEGLSVFKKSFLAVYILGSLVMVLFGLFLIALAIVSFVGPEFTRPDGGIQSLKGPPCLSFISCLAGLWVLVFPCLLPHGAYWIESPHLDSIDLRKWRIARYWFSGRKLDRFVRSIRRDHVGPLEKGGDDITPG
jgi:hypothetical protein